MPAPPITVRAPKGGGGGGGRGGSKGSSGSSGSKGSSGGGSSGGGDGIGSTTKGGSSSKTGSKSGWGSGGGAVGSGGYRPSRPRPAGSGAAAAGGGQSKLKWWEILLIVWAVLFTVAFVASGIWYWRKERSRVRAQREAEEDPSYDPTGALAPGSPSADPRFRTRWVLLKALAFASGLALPIWAFRRWGHRWKGFRGAGRRATKGMPYEKMARHDLDHDPDDMDDLRYARGRGRGREQGYGDGKRNADAKYEPMGYNNAPPPPPPPP